MNVVLTGRQAAERKEGKAPWRETRSRGLHFLTKTSSLMAFLKTHKIHLLYDGLCCSQGCMKLHLQGKVDEKNNDKVANMVKLKLTNLSAEAPVSLFSQNSVRTLRSKFFPAFLL